MALKGAYDALVSQLKKEVHLHSDETGWLVPMPIDSLKKIVHSYRCQPRGMIFRCR